MNPLLAVKNRSLWSQVLIKRFCNDIVVPIVSIVVFAVGVQCSILGDHP